MKTNDEVKTNYSRDDEDEVNFAQLIAQLRQVQLEAAIAGHMAESAFFATEARVLREQSAQEDALCV